ncbi:MAG: hypothetical protein Q8L85_03870 [Alphaproteobacteria bacterium]|nr:hypothetical protein [Alphaproteobacteria bacterium]
MKKTILTLSILISSPAFVVFAGGVDNTIEITSLSVKELTAIAQNISASEHKRIDACKNLLTLSTSTFLNKEVISILLNIFQQSQDDNLFSELVSDQNFMKKHFNQSDLVPLFLNIAKNANNKKIKFNAFEILWNDRRANFLNLDELVNIKLDYIKNELDEHQKYIEFKRIFSNDSVKFMHRKTLESILLNLFKNTKDEEIKSKYFEFIKKDTTIEENFETFDIFFQYEFDQCVNNKNNKIKILNKYLNRLKNTEYKNKKFNELISKIFNYIESENDKYNKIEEINVIKKFARETNNYDKDLKDFLSKIFHTTNDKIIKYYSAEILWGASVAQDKYFNIFVQSELDRWSNHELNQFKVLETLFKNQEIKENKLNIVKSEILNFAINTKNEYFKLSALIILLNDVENRNNHCSTLIKLLLDVSNSNDIWLRFKIDKKDLNTLINSILDLIRNEENSLEKHLVIKFILKNQNITMEQRDKLFLLLLDFTQNASEKEIRDEATDLIMRNAHFRMEYESILIVAFQRRISEEPSNMDLKLRAYIAFGTPFQEEFNHFISEHWRVITNNQKQQLCENIIDHFGDENPRVQELILLYARDGSPSGGAIKVYADLLLKLKDPYVHNPSATALTFEENNQTFRFAINPEIFKYLPISQEPLATLEDVKLILGDAMDDITKGVSDNSDLENYDAIFRSYFVAPFSEESMMLQAMVKKFKNMEPEKFKTTEGGKGQKKLAYLITDMRQCKQGKNQAIWDHYSIESKPLCLAELKNVTDWLIRLQETNNPYISDADLSSFKISRNQMSSLVPHLLVSGHMFNTDLSSFELSRKEMITLISTMLNANHIFRRHLTDLKTEDALRLKALLGSIVDLEKSIDLHNKNALGESLKSALNILVQLSNVEEFYNNLNKLCDIHEIYLPANKFGDQLSSIAIEGLIQKLKVTDIQGRGVLTEIQDDMRQFVERQDFFDLLQNFDSEQGNKLRELVRGYVINGWSVGLLNLMTLARADTLNKAVDVTYEYTKIDKDMSLTWDSLKTVMIRELIDIKRQSINLIAEKLTRQAYNFLPHQIGYIEGLLGNAIGLCNAHKTPNFDLYMNQSTITSKSLQDVLDLFHEDFTATKLINHFNKMIDEDKLSIIDPNTGKNIINHLLGIAAADQLKGMGIDTSVIDLDMLLLDEQVETSSNFCMALLLTKLGILNAIDENNHPIVNNTILD